MVDPKTRHTFAAAVAAVIVLYPAAAHAHGIPPAFAVFILTFAVLGLAACPLADYVAIKRALVPDRAGAAAIEANILALLAAIAGLYLLDLLIGYLPALLEREHIDYARHVRMYGMPVGLLLLALVILFAKVRYLAWRFAIPFSARTLMVLGLASLSGIAAAALLAALAASVIVN